MNVVGMEAIYHDSSLNRRRMDINYRFLSLNPFLQKKLLGMEQIQVINRERRTLFDVLLKESFMTTL